MANTSVIPKVIKRLVIRKNKNSSTGRPPGNKMPVDCAGSMVWRKTSAEIWVDDDLVDHPVVEVPSARDRLHPGFGLGRRRRDSPGTRITDRLVHPL